MSSKAFSCALVLSLLAASGCSPEDAAALDDEGPDEVSSAITLGTGWTKTNGFTSVGCASRTGSVNGVTISTCYSRSTSTSFQPFVRFYNAASGSRLVEVRGLYSLVYNPSGKWEKGQEIDCGSGPYSNIPHGQTIYCVGKPAWPSRGDTLEIHAVPLVNGIPSSDGGSGLWHIQ
ncbi:MAG TPA: hypothetical protein VHU40_14635 [Polyangia bacterium]|jgi:hypothetical protein|nr:hypothetical protein [Polyangia bacterium]